jgi:mitochondrial fission protein ELM1
MKQFKSWVVSEPKIGTLSQCLSVARYFDPTPAEKTFLPNRRLLRLFDAPLFRRSEPRPDLVVSCGFRSEKRVMGIKAAYGGTPVSVHLQAPKIEGYDLVFVSRHDWIASYDARPNYHQMLGVPHRFTPEFWAGRRMQARAKYARDDQKLAVVLLGGANGAYDYDAAAVDMIKQSIHVLVERGWKVLVSVSRRSSGETQNAIATLNAQDVSVWDRKSENPYVDYLAAADAFLIAKDSVTMPCEALSTGKPVYSLDLTHIPGERLEKFERFHADLAHTLKLTRSFAGDLVDYDYQVPNEALRISGMVMTHLNEQQGAGGGIDSPQPAKT